jgi:hypothetical protein
VLPAAKWTTGVGSITYSNSDRTATGSGNSEKSVYTTTAKSSGKWYAELSYFTGAANREDDEFFGVIANTGFYPGQSGSSGFGTADTRGMVNNAGGSTSGTLPSWSSGTNVYMVAVDFDNKKAWLGLNGSWTTSSDPAAGTGANVSAWTGTPSFRVATRVFYNSDAVTIVESQAYRPSGFEPWDS